MKNFFDGMVTNTGVVGEVLVFLWQRRLWWLIPMVTVLLLFGLLLIFASSSGVAAFIYTLFYCYNEISTKSLRRTQVFRNQK